MRFPVFFSLLIAGLVLTSCNAKFDWPWLKSSPSARASGHVVTEDRTLASFDQIAFEGVGTLVFDASIPSGVLRVKADEGILSTIRTSVDGSKLRISEEGLQGPGSWDLEFRTAPPSNLSAIDLEGMGSVEGDVPLVTTKDLDISLTGMGKVRLNVEAPQVTIRQEGQGEILLTGKTGSVVIQAQGLGKVDASGLIAPQADVHSQGVGEVRVYASERLKVRADGLGSVRFSGNPAQTDVQTEGLTKVTGD